jgi:hypothetical protein
VLLLERTAHGLSFDVGSSVESTSTVFSDGFMSRRNQRDGLVLIAKALLTPGKRSTHEQGLLLSSDMVLRKTLQKTYNGVQRNMKCQFYAARRLGAIGHGTLGPRGIAALEQHTISAGCCLKIMETSVDWLYNQDQFENLLRESP